jgi:HAD superfamily hydrolase (TIGR01509 family)
MTPSRAFDAVIFDLDGVLVDSEIWWDEARAAFAVAHGREWTRSDRLAVMGANSPTWSKVMRDRLHLDLAAAQIEAWVVAAMVERYAREGPPIIAGAVEAARRIARQLPVAVASSAHPSVIEAALAATGLAGLFAAVASSDEVQSGKPAPDVYLLAAERLEVTPGRCLVVEDSFNGIRAARAAGMRVVLVPNRSVPPAEGAAALADATLESLADLDPLDLDLEGGRPAEDVVPGGLDGPPAASDSAPPHTRRRPRR